MKYLSLVAALALTALCSPVAAMDTESECARNERVWLEANSSKLPHSFAEILAFPEEERRMAFRAVDAATQSAIWRGQYEAFLQAEAGNLNADQRAIVQRAIAVSTPELYSLRQADPGFASAQAPLAQVIADAKAQFSAEQVRALFFRLGLTEELAQGKDKGGPIQGLGNCNCSTYLDCWYTYACNSQLCIAVQGCGPGYTEGCWGKCG